uniref:F-box domain-containing protein n=1 Tax=Leersia perrieri TaxID=77586 RepID=A0A0D9W2Z6_9ORYZ
MASADSSQCHDGSEKDYLSNLPDSVVGHILSFLPTDEAARTAVLARRWRHSLADVHTISFKQQGYRYVHNDDDEVKNRNTQLVGRVNATMLSRCRASGGKAGGLRTFRVTFYSFNHSLTHTVDEWLSVAMKPCAEEIHVDAHRREERSCQRERSRNYSTERDGDKGGGSDGEDPDDFRNEDSRDLAYPVPSGLLFSSACAGMRTLYLGSCFLNLPPAGDSTLICLPSVETRKLLHIPDSGKDIQRLVSACPRLADLTLESCRRVRLLTVLGGPRLRSLTLRCCHGALTRILVRAPNLEILSLLIFPYSKRHSNYDCLGEVKYQFGADLDFPNLGRSMWCTKGRVPQRVLLKLLLSMAMALEELYVVFPKGPYEVQAKLMGEIQRWVMNRPVQVKFA